MKVGTFSEDGSVAEVEILSDTSDTEWNRYKLRVLTVQASDPLCPLEPGQEFEVTQKKNAGYWGGMWSLRDVHERASNTEPCSFCNQPATEFLPSPYCSCCNSIPYCHVHADERRADDKGFAELMTVLEQRRRNCFSMMKDRRGEPVRVMITGPTTVGIFAFSQN